MGSQNTIPANETLALMPAPNGGWVVRSIGGMCQEPVLLGAYSCAADMLQALSEALTDAQPT